MAIRLFGADRAFFNNDLEGPMQKPIVRLTRYGAGGQKIISDDPVSIVYYGAQRIPVLTPGRNLTVTEERLIEFQQAEILPIGNPRALGIGNWFNALAGRIGITRDWAGRPRGGG